MTTLPAVVTISDLASTAALSSSALFEAMQTTSGQPESVQTNLSQMLAQMNIAGSLVASTGISIAGSTTATIALATTAPLSVLGVAGAATATPLPIAGTGAQVLRVNDAGTAIEFGAVNLGSSAAVTGILTVPFGGIGLSTLATGDLLYASNDTTLARLATVTSGFLLAATGTTTAPAYTTVIGDNITWRIGTSKVQFALDKAVPAGGSTTLGITLSSAANLGWFVGTGAPSLSAATGSLYSRLDATTASTRLYINTNGAGTWTNFTTAA